MSFTEVALAAFLLGPIGAIGVVPAAMVVLAVRRRRWALWLGVALTLVVAAGFVGFWFLWGQAFDYADMNQTVPARLETGKYVTMTMAAVGSLGLIATAFTALLLPRRAR